MIWITHQGQSILCLKNEQTGKNTKYINSEYSQAVLLEEVCWDADRLDLGRGGVRPDTGKLCTDIAKSPAFFEQAYQRAIFTPCKINRSKPSGSGNRPEGENVTFRLIRQCFQVYLDMLRNVPQKT